MSDPKTTGRPRTLDTGNLAPLESWLARSVDARTLAITAAELLPGGAVGENWKLDVAVDGGAKAGTHTWVLRTDAAARIGVSLDRADEYAVLRAAAMAGVRVPEPIARAEEADIIGAPFMILGFVGGTAQARRIVRDPGLATFGPDLAEELGRQLARIHTIEPPADLPFLAVPERRAARDIVGDLRGLLDQCSDPRPALEWVLRWLELNAPEARRITLVHGDFRTGNFMIDGARLTAILDWEFAHWGDPIEDLGWFTARCWRFGNDALEAGGIAPLGALLDGYNAVSAEPVSEREISYWQILAAARWAAIAVLQGERHRSGREPSLELQLTGLMAPEMELDAIDDIRRLVARSE